MNNQTLHELFDEMEQELEDSKLFVGQRVWQKRSDLIFDQETVQEQHAVEQCTRQYTDDQLVDLFIQMNDWWFVDETNSLFGWREKVRKELKECLKYGVEGSPDNFELIYCVNNFFRDWVGPQGIFFESEYGK